MTTWSAIALATISQHLSATDTLLNQMCSLVSEEQFSSSDHSPIKTFSVITFDEDIQINWKLSSQLIQELLSEIKFVRSFTSHPSILESPYILYPSNFYTPHFFYIPHFFKPQIFYIRQFLIPHIFYVPQLQYKFYWYCTRAHLFAHR